MIDYQDSLGYTALARASESGHSQIVAALLDAHADPTIATRSGMTPFLLAAKIGNSQIVQKLYDASKDVISAVNKEGWSALHWAVTGDNMRMSRQLLQYGLDAFQKDNRGKSPYDYAIMQNATDLQQCFSAWAMDASRKRTETMRDK